MADATEKPISNKSKNPPLRAKPRAAVTKGNKFPTETPRVKAVEKATAKPVKEIDTSSAGASGDQPAPSSGRFGKAIEEALASVQALRSDGIKAALGRSEDYRKVWTDKSNDFTEKARDFSGQSRAKAEEYARQGQVQTSETLVKIGAFVAGNAGLLDETLGSQFGDYARGTARQLHGVATWVEGKDFAEVGDDARKFVRDNPVAALGLATVAGFMLARMFRSSTED